MSTNSKIQWTTHTFNPWRGCTKVSDGCKNCYAEKMSGRNPKSLGVWGQNGTRAIAAESYWKMPFAWDKAAAAADERHRVFCASLADVFEGQGTMPDNAIEPVEKARSRLFGIIDRTPNLDWLLVTKRPENIPHFWPGWIEDFGSGRAASHRKNVWLLTSVENQETANVRIPFLKKCRDLVPVLGLSIEPLLGPVDLKFFLKHPAMPDFIVRPGSVPVEYIPVVGIDWVIVGGESGGGARAFDVQWARSIIGQCKATRVPCFVKQLGAKPYFLDRNSPMGSPDPGDNETTVYPVVELKIKDPKGGDPQEWPEDLRVRQLPQSRDIA